MKHIPKQTYEKLVRKNYFQKSAHFNFAFVCYICLCICEIILPVTLKNVNKSLPFSRFCLICDSQVACEQVYSQANLFEQIYWQADFLASMSVDKHIPKSKSVNNLGEKSNCSLIQEN